MAYRKTRKLRKRVKRRKFPKTKRKSLRGGGLFNTLKGIGQSTPRIPFIMMDQSEIEYGTVKFTIPKDGIGPQMIYLSPTLDIKGNYEGEYIKPENNTITMIIYDNTPLYTKKEINNDNTNIPFSQTIELRDDIKSMIKRAGYDYVKGVFPVIRPCYPQPTNEEIQKNRQIPDSIKALLKGKHTFFTIVYFETSMLKKSVRTKIKEQYNKNVKDLKQ